MVVLAAATMAVTSCKPKLKDVTGVVTSVETSYLGDTVKSMKMFDGQDTLVCNVREARLNNGMMIVGDSVDVSYVAGKGDTLRALLIHVKPRPAQVIKVEVDTTKTLLTR